MQPVYLTGFSKWLGGLYSFGMAPSAWRTRHKAESKAHRCTAVIEKLKALNAAATAKWSTTGAVEA